MKVTFKGIPGEPDTKSVYMYGHNFKQDEAVEVTDPTAQRKLAGHPHFESDGEAPPVDDATLRTYVNTVMEAGLTALKRQAEQQGKQTATEEPPTPTAAPAPAPLRSAQEYQDMERAGFPPAPAPKSAEELRADLEKAEQAEKEAADANADAERARNQDSAEDPSGRSAGSGKRGRSGDRT